MSTNQLTILLAEDDIDDCTFFKEALAELSLSAHLTTVKDGAELMNHLSANEDTLPDVLFLDINMPRKSGPECLLEIRRNTKLKDLPIVIFSTSNAVETISKVFDSGADVYIHKPSDFSQLKQVINHALPMAAKNVLSKDKLKYILNA